MASDVPVPLTIKEILGGLKPGQLWALVTAVATLVSGAFALGLKYQSVLAVAPAPTPAAPTVSQDLKPCSEVPTYPVGVWIQSGRITLRISAIVTGDFGNVTDLGLGAELRD